MLVASLLAGCGREKKAQAGAGDAAAPPVVAVAKVTTGSLSNQIDLTAEFRPYQEVDVHAKVAGYLKKIYVDAGDRVAQGQLLAVLEIPELDDEMAQMSAVERRSEAELARAREEVQRSQSAFSISSLSYNRLAEVLKTRPNLVAQQEVDEAEARNRMAGAQLSAAKAALAAAEQQVQVSKAGERRIGTLQAYSRITAPFAGVVTKRYADTGAMIQAGTASQTQAMPVVRISENTRLRLVLPVPESLAARLRAGRRVEVRVASLDRTFTGMIARFSGKVNTATRTMETEVDVPNPALVLVPGMYASATLTLEQKANALVVPLQAVSGHDTEPKVLVVNGEKKLEERAVKLGVEDADNVEVLSGVGQGDLVVIGNRSQLRPGQTVEPKVAREAM
ncbi:MAG: efflux RND transporter periplasmic adaptor subunit [Candidatus Solibacter usitatus]|nr:efflux RND transporter periplasmic adaptor subunit [Candidatus Solibacter usitatus]